MHTRDNKLIIFKRFSQRFQYLSGEMRQLIKKQDSIMSKCYFSGFCFILGGRTKNR